MEARMSAGHNSVSADQLRTIIERVENLEAEKRELSEDIKEVYGEAKSNGFDTAAIRAIIRMRREDSAKRKEREAMIELYLSNLGLLD
jgi:uncharacterized protein (UPF0335 family)